ncbi:hypothetical protein [Dawidia soli]|uniref:Carbohydrate-binding domain-containing protein n=1 Tax=Dawidia soli TaxID=2782352 RepID=A0AAP2DD39_9BACT|nr:hypothetical protein [Dawidia soli]MBT1689469.1 hypothetical protein [Dawidia soli]
MKTFIFSILLVTSCRAFAQTPIDLKTLIGKPREVAEQQLTAWNIPVTPSTDDTGLWVGYDEGIQIKFKKDIITTIWIEFTDRRSGAFPFVVDAVVTPNVDIRNVVKVLGNPSETEEGFTIGDKTSGWVKWITKAYQLHCQVSDSEIYMVTLMEPDWYPGKD